MSNFRNETVVTVVQPTQQHSNLNKDNSLNWLQFNTGYFKAIPGILKLVQLVSIIYFEKLEQINKQLRHQGHFSNKELGCSYGMST
jgi:hypothetical protein